MYADDTVEVAAALHVDPRRGLTSSEAIRRSMHYGKNVVHAGESHSLAGELVLLGVATFEALFTRRRPHVAQVLADGIERTVNAADLVPGDVIVVDAGAEVPADARIVSADELKVDEAALTGELVPVVKSPHAVAADAPLAARHSMLYFGTHIIAGHATAIVTATGDATELARITHSA